MSKQLDLEQRIIDLAQRDDSFRKALLTDPKQTIEEKLGIKTPNDLKIVVVEDTADKMHIVLPPKIDKPGDIVAWT